MPISMLSWLVLAYLYVTGWGMPLTQVATLDVEMEETSGLINLGGRIITHNDSGGTPSLYEIDTTTGGIARRVWINGTTTRDWEDICRDDTYIYIGDIGNNFGSRTDLAVYRVPIAGYEAGLDTLVAEAIPFRFGDQVDFDPLPFQNNFDAETLVDFGDSLLVFTKNWGDSKTRVYALEKALGPEQAPMPMATIDVGGKVTSGVYDADREVIVLVGYNGFIPFVVEVEVDNGCDFRACSWTKTLLQTTGGSTQIEGITLGNDGGYFLSAEGSVRSDAVLYRSEIESISATIPMNESAVAVYPNPTRDELTIVFPNLKRVHLMDASGRIVKTSTTPQMELSNLSKGQYTLRVKSNSGEQRTQIVVIE